MTLTAKQTQPIASKVEHFVITQIGLSNQEMGEDPRHHAPISFAQRAELLNALCLPSLLAQSNQDFTWIILTGRSLPLEHRRVLEKVAERRPRSVVVELPKQGLLQHGWLLPHRAHPDTDLVLTTILDSDDALREDYLETLRTVTTDAGPFRLLGSSESFEWDLIRVRTAPLGYRKAWLARHPASAGASVLSTLPAFDWTVFAFPHHLMPSVLKTPPPPELASRVVALRAAYEKAKLPVPSDAFWPVRSSALTSNHLACLQLARLVGGPHLRVPAQPSFLAEFGVDLDKVREVMATRRALLKRLTGDWIRTATSPENDTAELKLRTRYLLRGLRGIPRTFR